MENGLDPIKVKCAIAALRQEMGKDRMPSRIMRFCNIDEGKTQKYLNLIRQLRQGKLDNVKVKRRDGTTLNYDLHPFNEQLQEPTATVYHDPGYMLNEDNVFSEEPSKNSQQAVPIVPMTIGQSPQAYNYSSQDSYGMGAVFI